MKGLGSLSLWFLLHMRAHGLGGRWLAFLRPLLKACISESLFTTDKLVLQVRLSRRSFWVCLLISLVKIAFFSEWAHSYLLTTSHEVGRICRVPLPTVRAHILIHLQKSTLYIFVFSLSHSIIMIVILVIYEPPGVPTYFQNISLANQLHYETQKCLQFMYHEMMRELRQ